MKIQSVMLVFLPQLSELLPFNLLSGFNSPPPFPVSMCQSSEHTDAVWLGGGEVLSPVGDHILQEFNTLYLNRFRTYKIARPPTAKNLGEEGASDR
jgi:hypothetical protein